MSKTSDQLPMVSTNVDRPAHKRMLPADGSTLETRIAGDYFGVGELVQMLFGALMLESPYRCQMLMEECGHLFDSATSSSFREDTIHNQAALLRLVYRLFEELDFHNYRLELVKSAPRHR